MRRIFQPLVKNFTDLHAYEHLTQFRRLIERFPLILNPNHSFEN